jgi:hypothetical protein
MIDSSPGMSFRRTLLALATAGLLAGGCDYVYPARWVLWWSVGGGAWVPMHEFRTLQQCNQALTHEPSNAQQRCLPYGQVPAPK